MAVTDIVPRATVEDLCRYRQEAIEMYRQGMECLAKAARLHAKAAPGVNTSFSFPADIGSRLRYDDLDVKDPQGQAFAAEMAKAIDRGMWKSLITSTNLWSIMDKIEQERFEAGLKDPPPVTPEAVATTIARLSGEGDMIFRRGLVSAFQNLNRDYRSHDGFKIGARLVIPNAISNASERWRTLSHYREKELADIDRVMHVLDGKPAPDYQQGLCAEIRARLQPDDSAGLVHMGVDTAYWGVKFFRNGNIHLWPVRQDLVDKANRIIAEHFGLVVGDKTAKGTAAGRKARPRGKPGGEFYATPAAVFDKIRWAFETDEVGVRTALEPSAGEGSIASRLVGGGYVVDCVETHPIRARVLVEQGLYRSVCVADFLDQPTVPSVDLVVMNPPFSSGQDILHVSHAWDCLKPGGRLVAIMSAGIRFRNDRLYKEFRDWLTLHGGCIHDLPDDAFATSGTNVKTVYIVVDKGER